MPSLKEVRNRITSVKSTQQITKAMKMVAAAKLRKSQDRITQMRPYSQKLGAILNNILANNEGIANSEFMKARDIQKVLIVVVTSDRGLCGAFNSNAIKSTVALINEKYATQQSKGNVAIMPIGKKGKDFFSKRNYKIVGGEIDIFTKLTFDNVRLAAEIAMNGFIKGEFDAVELVYNEFKNVATQVIRKESFLPLVLTAPQADKSKENKAVDYTFEPNEEEIVNQLLPKTLKIQFYKAVLESNASEHGARMTAMDKATDNAAELIKELTLMYNRTRQAAITKEILEIVGGAEALANG